MKKTKNYWYGKEIEGRLYGVETAYIPRDFKPKKKFFNKFQHYLIGPELIKSMNSGKSNITWKKIESLIDEKMIMITLEVKPGLLQDIPQSMKLKCHILYWIDAEELSELKSSDSVKIAMRSHDMYVFTLFNGQRVTRNDYLHDRYDTK